MDEFLGKSIKWPIEITAGGNVATVEGMDSLKQGLFNALACAYRALIFNRAEGSRVGDLLFEPNDDILKGLLGVYTREVVEVSEPRVMYLDTDFFIGESTVTMQVHYEVKATQERDFVEFPLTRTAA